VAQCIIEKIINIIEMATERRLGKCDLKTNQISAHFTKIIRQFLILNKFVIRQF